MAQKFILNMQSIPGSYSFEMRKNTEISKKKLKDFNNSNKS